MIVVKFVWFVIVELAECSPIIMQNSSDPSSRKKFGWTTVQGTTFNMRGQLYCGHASAMALSSSPVVSAPGSKLDNMGSSPGQGKVLCPNETCGKKKYASSAFRLG